ncbi:MAG: ATP-binding cassette domain-containing protein, partial [Cyanobacteria bacterium J06648_11]
MNGKATLSTPTSSSAAGPLAIDVADLSKTYRTGFYMNQLVTPLQHCSFSVSTGETFGLLGPNGAGKTTTIKCLLGIVSPNSGTG